MNVIWHACNTRPSYQPFRLKLLPAAAERSRRLCGRLSPTLRPRLALDAASNNRQRNVARGRHHRFLCVRGWALGGAPQPLAAGLDPHISRSQCSVEYRPSEPRPCAMPHTSPLVPTMGPPPPEASRAAECSMSSAPDSLPTRPQRLQRLCLDPGRHSQRAQATAP